MRVKHITAFILVGAFLFGAALLASLATSYNAKAQNIDDSFLTNPGAIRDNDINVDLIPEVPGPNQNVKITLSSFSTDIDKATITWNLNGEQAATGIGRKTFSVTTGEIGSKTEIGIVIIVAEGTRVDKRITIQPSQVDLLWEAPDSYVPPFYKGKAMAVQESKVKVVALPIEKDGSIQPANKVYNWKKNYVVDQNASGYGKYTFTVKNSYLDRADNVTVGASSQSGAGSTGSLVINYDKPLILVYEKNPSLGLRLEKLLNNGVDLKDGEMTVSAEPFYFSRNKNGVTGENMQYRWNINGNNIVPPSKPNELTIRGSSQAGAASVSISVTNVLTLFQEAKQTLNVTLGK